MQAYQKRGFSLSPGMEIGYVIKDAAKWEVDTEREASEFDAGYYRKLLDKAWGEIGSPIPEMQERLCPDCSTV